MAAAAAAARARRSRRHRRAGQGALAARFDPAGDPQPDRGAFPAQLARGQRLAAGGARRARRAGAQPRRADRAGGSGSPRSSRKRSQRALASGGQALGAGDVAMAAGERRRAAARRGGRTASRSARSPASSPREEPAPPSPFAPEGRAPRPAFRLPAAGRRAGHRGPRVGQRQRRPLARHDAGDAVAERRSPRRPTAWSASPGPFRDYDGVLIIDHGGGWMSLIVNVASPLAPGRPGAASATRSAARSARCEVELSQNGRRISPALIAGSSQTLSKGAKGG